jgi:outer membrane receptor protein involved in Fe transport
VNAPACQQIQRNPTNGNGGLVDRSFTNEGRAVSSGIDLALNWSKQLTNGGRISLNSSANINLEEIQQDRPALPEVDNAGYNNCGLQLQCQNYDFRLFTTVGYGTGPWNISLRHQYWPELDNNACRTNPASTACVYNSLPAFDLFSLSGNYMFDRYTVSLGIENLLDEEPPCLNANPTAVPFPLDCTRTGDGSTYDPLGRRFFLSMTMDF